MRDFYPPKGLYHAFVYSTHTGCRPLNHWCRSLPFVLSKLQGGKPYPLSSKARAGANGTKIFLLPLFSYMVRLPVIIARCLVCVETQVRSSCKTENNTDFTFIHRGGFYFSPKCASPQPKILHVCGNHC